MNVLDWLEQTKKKVSPLEDQLKQFMRLKKIDVYGYPGVFYERVTQLGGALEGITTFQTPGNLLIHFNGNLNYQEHWADYQQILSTFEFVR